MSIAQPYLKYSDNYFSIKKLEGAIKKKLEVVF